MNTEQTLKAIREAIRMHSGDEKELLEELDAEHAGWMMRLDEIENEQEGE
jgi:hypothetical protein